MGIISRGAIRKAGKVSSRKTCARTSEGSSSDPPLPTAWQPKRLVRTVLSSLAPFKTFGGQMVCEAKRRPFFEAKAQVFLGDGLPWNWSIRRKHFATLSSTRRSPTLSTC